MKVTVVIMEMRHLLIEDSLKKWRGADLHLTIEGVVLNGVILKRLLLHIELIMIIQAATQEERGVHI